MNFNDNDFNRFDMNDRRDCNTYPRDWNWNDNRHDFDCDDRRWNNCRPCRCHEERKDWCECNRGCNHNNCNNRKRCCFGFFRCW